MFRVGIGYDVHRLVKGRKLILGGVHIKYAKGLKGHSDADVIMHAICDALLGAAGLGDIGAHFPNTDPKYKNIPSSELLSYVGKLVRESRYRIGNIDVMLIAEEPTIKPYLPAMHENVINALGMNNGCVSVKATTNEKLGFIGQKKGMAAFAVALIEKN